MTVQTEWAVRAHESEQERDLKGDCVPTFTCDVDGCSRSFEKAQALSMHKTRTHRPAGQGIPKRSVRITLTVPLDKLMAIATVEKVEA